MGLNFPDFPFVPMFPCQLSEQSPIIFQASRSIRGAPGLAFAFGSALASHFIYMIQTRNGRQSIFTTNTNLTYPAFGVHYSIIFKISCLYNSGGRDSQTSFLIAMSRTSGGDFSFHIPVRLEELV